MKTKILVILGVVLFLLVNSLFVVTEFERSVVIRLGKPIKIMNHAGLYLKAPFIDNVRMFSKQLQEYDFPPAEVITRDKKTLIVDNYTRWRVSNPQQFLQAVQNVHNAQARLDDIVYSVVREKLGKYDLSQIISENREELTKMITNEAKIKVADLGVEVVDVRIKKTELPAQNEEFVYRRMATERDQQAKKYRAEGVETSIKIKTEAEKERTIIMAEAYKTSSTIKGEGDATALKIYADAYNRDKEFYKFLRTLEAYEKTFNANDTIIMSTDSEMYKTFGR